MTAVRRALLVSLLPLLACSRSETPSAYPNAPVILISIDTLRADHLRLYGYKNVATPNIDALAHDGVTFDYAISHVPLTLPSHVSILTGLLPPTNGVRNNLGFRYEASKFISLPQVLKQHGYATGAAVSSYVLRGETGLRDAFDFYDDAVEQRHGVNASEYQRGGAATVAVLTKWLESVETKPFFAFLHLYEPHAPYSPPEPFRSQFAPYDGEIAYADRIVGDFLDDLKRRGIYDRAIIVLLSDHGEGLGDHGEQQHGALLYIEELRVPLVIKLPKSARGGTRVASHAALVDVMPTIERLVGLTPVKTEGVDLFAPQIPARDIYSETIYPYLQLGWSDERSLITNNVHYIHATKPEMYEVASDPREQKNILADNRREASRLRDLVAGFAPPTEGNATISAEDQAKLAALGYVGSVKANPGNGPLPNPRDEVALIEDTRRANALADKGDEAGALQQLKAIVAKSPRFVDVWIRIAEINVGAGRFDDAIDAYKQAIAAAGPLSSDIVADLGYVYFEAGKLDDAEHAAEIAAAGSPHKAMTLQVRVAGTKGDLARAERIAQQLASRPDATPADVLLLAEVEVARGHLDDALKLIDRAGATYGGEALRAEVLFKLHRIDEAIAADQREIAAFPHNGAAYTHLASMQYVSGHKLDAQATLEMFVRANPSPSAYAAAARTMASLGDMEAAKQWQARGR